MADRQVALQALQDRLGKNLGHETHALVHLHRGAVRDDDPGTFLTAMLQGVKAEIGEFGGIVMIVNAAHPAFVGGASVRGFPAAVW